MKDEEKVVKVFNFHVTHICNYNCIYCFCKFKDKNYISLTDACKVVDNIERYFILNNIETGRINLAGGEPLTYPYLDELIDYIYQKHIQISIITNGSLLTLDKIERWKEKVFCIGISIDSTREKIRNKIGRKSDKQKPLTNSEMILICKKIKESGIKLKINSVISKFNVQESMVDFFEKISPDRIKFLKMQIVNGINDEAKEYSITKNEYKMFSSNHRKLKNVVYEDEHDMENSYLMINGKGELILNNNGNYDFYGDCLLEEISDILKKVPFNYERFNKRYPIFPYEAKRKIWIFGGHPTWVKSLKKLLSNVTFMTNDEITSKIKLSKGDVFWIQNNALSHSFYNKIIDVARTFDIPCQYFKFKGSTQCAKQLIDYEEAEKNNKQ